MKIFKLCGSPNEQSWQGVSGLPHFAEISPEKQYERRLRKFLKGKRPE